MVTQHWNLTIDEMDDDTMKDVDDATLYLSRSLGFYMLQSNTAITSIVNTIIHIPLYATQLELLIVVQESANTLLAMVQNQIVLIR